MPRRVTPATLDLIRAQYDPTRRVRVCTGLELTLTTPVGFVSFAYGQDGDIAFAADFDGDGRPGIGVFRPAAARWLYRIDLAAGPADFEIFYGLPDDLPIVGDWDGDGRDGLGVFRDGTWILRNSPTSGVGDFDFDYGGAGDLPIAGDWNGDGVDGVGVYVNGTWNLRQTPTAGLPDLTFDFGGAGDLPIVGDWNGDGVDGVGVYRPATGEFFTTDALEDGAADAPVARAAPNAQPLVIPAPDGALLATYADGRVQYAVRGVAPLRFASYPFARGWQARIIEAGDLRREFGAESRWTCRIDNAPLGDERVYDEGEFLGARAVVFSLLTEYLPSGAVAARAADRRFGGVVAAAPREDATITVEVVGEPYARLIGAIRPQSQRCWLRFKSPECGYEGDGTACSKIYDDADGGCLFYDNQHRFQGIPQLARDVITLAGGTGTGAPPGGGYGGTGGAGGYGSPNDRHFPWNAML